MARDVELPFSINLGDKVAVITGGGGVLCSMFARALACCGARVALLDLNLEAAQKQPPRSSPKAAGLGRSRPMSWTGRTCWPLRKRFLPHSAPAIY